MRLIIGLGNPGKKYYHNRHNIGFQIIENYAKSKGLTFKKRLIYDFVKDQDILYVKPKTFMNNSGNAVTSILTKYKIEDLMVIVDDIYLPLGEIRLRQEGGFGGHNGLKSIAKALGTDEFKRLRIGVGSPDNEILSNYVLADFSKCELDILNIVLKFTETLLNEYIKGDFKDLLDAYSRLRKSYSEKIDQLRIDSPKEEMC